MWRACLWYYPDPDPLYHREPGGERALRVASLLRVTAELEDIGDCCNRLVQLAHRKYRKNRVLPEETLREIKVFSEQIIDFMELYQTHLGASWGQIEDRMFPKT